MDEGCAQPAAIPTLMIEQSKLSLSLEEPIEA
jgi:hypothetical protein